MVNLSELSADEIRKKAKKRKAMDEPCEASTGWEDRRGHPVILMCHKRPSKYYPEFGHFGVYLCNEHLESQLLKMEKK